MIGWSSLVVMYLGPPYDRLDEAGMSWTVHQGDLQLRVTSSQDLGTGGREKGGQEKQGGRRRGGGAMYLLRDWALEGGEAQVQGDPPLSRLQQGDGRLFIHREAITKLSVHPNNVISPVFYLTTSLVTIL